MRAMRRVDGKWQTEGPADLSRWLWRQDGAEAVVIDDAAKVYYCSRPEDAVKYREAWQREGKQGDRRTAAMFIDLDRQLFEAEKAAEGGLTA